MHADNVARHREQLRYGSKSVDPFQQRSMSELQLRVLEHRAAFRRRRQNGLGNAGQVEQGLADVVRAIVHLHVFGGLSATGIVPGRGSH